MRFCEGGEGGLVSVEGAFHRLPAACCAKGESPPAAQRRCGDECPQRAKASRDAQDVRGADGSDPTCPVALAPPATLLTPRLERATQPVRRPARDISENGMRCRDIQDHLHQLQYKTERLALLCGIPLHVVRLSRRRRTSARCMEGVECVSNIPLPDKDGDVLAGRRR